MDNEKNYMDNEIWKVYKIAYTNQHRTSARVYEVSNLGRVKCNGKIVEPHVNNRYLCISKFFIHRAVAELYVPNPENKPYVDHINTVTTDNRAENLRWVTHKENMNNPLSRKHISEARQGIVFSTEHRKKLSESHKGVPLSEEVKQKRRGKHLSEETKRKISESQRGKHRSEEFKQKARAARKEYWKKKKGGN